MRIYQWLVLMICLLVSGPLFAAEEYQDLSVLTQKAHDFLQDKLKPVSNERISFTLGQLDNRLRLPKCDPANIQVSIPNNDNPLKAKTLGINCRGTEAWTVYITSNVDVFMKIAVATKNIARGELISTHNVELVEKNSSSLVTGYFTSLEPLNQTVARRVILAGNPITPEIIQAETVIKRGDIVQISAVSNTFKVEMNGVAMSNGGVNENIYVMNPSSKRTIEARVVGAGKVEAAL